MSGIQSPLVLIIEDEAPIRRFLNAALTDNGYRVNEAASAAEGRRVACEQVPDLVILDLGLPDADGKTFLRELREWYRAPILILSARDQEHEKIAALDSGADDYVTKPFGTGELTARIRTLLRRCIESESADVEVEFGEVRVHLGNRTVERLGVVVHLTPLEYKLLTVLIRHPDKVLTHRFLLREVWGPSDAAESHYVRVYIAALRRKLESDPARPKFILTEPGIGYRFTTGRE